MNTNRHNKPKTVQFLVGLAAFVIFVAGIRAASDMLVPFLMSIFIAVLAAPPMHWLQKKGVPKWLALLLIISVIVLVSTLISILVGSSINNFTQTIPQYKAGLQEEITGLTEFLAKHGIDAPSTLIKDNLNPGAAMDLASKIFSGLGNVLANTFLILLTVMFILTETNSFPKKMAAAFSNAHLHLDGVEKFINNVKQYVAIKSLMSALTGGLIFIWMTILNVDYALLWGLLAFLLNYIPNIGSIIAALPAVMLAFLQHGSLIALLGAGGYVFVNTFVGNFLEPKYMGKGLGLSTLVVFLSLIFWGWIFGPVGMLLSVPLTMFVKIALDSNPDTRWVSILMDSETAYEDEPTSEIKN